MTRLLIKKGIDTNHSRKSSSSSEEEEQGANALMILFEEWQVDESRIVQLASLLLDEGQIDVNHQDAFGHNALMTLLRFSKSQNCQLLIDWRIDIEHKDNYGFNAAWWLIRYVDSDNIDPIARLLTSSSSNNSSNSTADNIV